MDLSEKIEVLKALSQVIAAATGSDGKSSYYNELRVLVDKAVEISKSIEIDK